jgi:hypothetical protein
VHQIDVLHVASLTGIDGDRHYLIRLVSWQRRRASETGKSALMSLARNDRNLAQIG